MTVIKWVVFAIDEERARHMRTRDCYPWEEVVEELGIVRARSLLDATALARPRWPGRFLFCMSVEGCRAQGYEPKTLPPARSA